MLGPRLNTRQSPGPRRRAGGDPAVLDRVGRTAPSARSVKARAYLLPASLKKSTISLLTYSGRSSMIKCEAPSTRSVRQDARM
jgi:hypothetical protein